MQHLKTEGSSIVTMIAMITMRFDDVRAGVVEVAGVVESTINERDGVLGRYSYLAIAEGDRAIIERRLEQGVIDVVSLGGVHQAGDLGKVAVPVEWISILVGWSEDVVVGGVVVFGGRRHLVLLARG